MDRAEQLADFLAGDLEPDEHAALEAELARDPALRVDLDAIRRADSALGQLPSPVPPAGFEQRLDAALAPAIATALAGRTGSTAADAAMTTDTAERPTDELGERRQRATQRRAGLPRWVTAVSGAAAALVVLAGAGVVISGVLGSGDDAGTFETQSLDTADDGEMSSDDAGDDATGSIAVDGPLLLASDRDLDEDAVRALLDDPDAFGLADRDLDAAAADQLSGPYAQALGARSGSEAPTAESDAMEAPESEDAAEDSADDGADADAGATTEDDSGEDAIEESAPADGAGAAELRMGPDISPADREQVGACLTELIGTEPGIVPVYAELASFEGSPAILFGLVTESPETGQFTRREVWVVDRSTCEVRLLIQN